MFESIKDMLTAWNAKHDDRIKLQHTYVVIGLFGVVIAGLVGLLNREVSQLIVGVSLASFGIAIANLFVWSLLYTIAIVKLQKTAKNSRK